MPLSLEPGKPLGAASGQPPRLAPLGSPTELRMSSVAGTTGTVGFLRQTALLLWKDVVVELRAKEIVYATILFASIVLLVFAFAFLGGERPAADVSAGVLWVAIALAGTVGISRAFEREREGDTLRALMLSPAPRVASISFARGSRR